MRGQCEYVGDCKPHPDIRLLSGKNHPVAKRLRQRPQAAHLDAIADDHQPQVLAARSHLNGRERGHEIGVPLF